MKYLLLFTVILMFTFCSNNTQKSTTLIICNKTNAIIDSIKINSYHVNETFYKIQNNIPIKRKLINITPPNTDGAFTITIFKNDSVKYAGGFGYFTKGTKMQDVYEIHILDGYKIKEIINH